MKKAMKKFLIVFGAFTLAFLMVSTATAVPQVHNRPLMNTINTVELKKAQLKERLLLQANKLQTFLESDRFQHLKSTWEQQIEQDNLAHLLDTPVLEKAKAVLGTTNLKEMVQGENEHVDIPELLVILLLTIYTEFIAYFLFLSMRHGMTRSFATLFVISAGASVLINVLTNPATNFVYNNLYDNIFVLETIVVVIETIMIFALFNLLTLPTTLLGALLLSLFANLMSFIFASSPGAADP